MDDLDVIRLAVAVIIAGKSVACARIEVKGKLGREGGSVSGDLPDPSTGIYLVRRDSFAGETPVLWREYDGGGFRVVWGLVSSLSQAW